MIMALEDVAETVRGMAAAVAAASAIVVNDPRLPSAAAATR